MIDSRSIVSGDSCALLGTATSLRRMLFIGSAEATGRRANGQNGREPGMAIVDLYAPRPAAPLGALAALSAPRGCLFLRRRPPAPTTAIRFTLDRKIDGPAAPFFLAIDKGYFKAEGLDVTIDVATGGPLEAIEPPRHRQGRYGGLPTSTC